MLSAWWPWLIRILGLCLSLVLLLLLLPPDYFLHGTKPPYSCGQGHTHTHEPKHGYWSCLSVLHRQHGKLCHSGGLIQGQATHAGRQWGCNNTGVEAHQVFSQLLSRTRLKNLGCRELVLHSGRLLESTLITKWLSLRGQCKLLWGLLTSCALNVVALKSVASPLLCFIILR